MHVAASHFYSGLNHNIPQFKHTLIILADCRFFLLRYSVGGAVSLCLVNNTRQQTIFAVSDSFLVQHEPGQQPGHLQEEDAAESNAGVNAK